MTSGAPLKNPLDQWLSIATRGLAPDSSAQVRTEITDHYQTALEAVASGVPYEEAPSAALLSLGDARHANRLYRRSLVTRTEELYLRYLRKNESVVPTRWYHVGFAWMVAMNLLVAVNAWDRSPWIEGPRANPLAALACALLWGFVWQRVWLILRMPERARRLRGEVTIALIVELVFLPALGVPWFGVAAIALIGFLTLRMHHSLRRKLPREQWPWALNV